MDFKKELKRLEALQQVMKMDIRSETYNKQAENQRRKDLQIEKQKQTLLSQLRKEKDK